MRRCVARGGGGSVCPRGRRLTPAEAVGEKSEAPGGSPKNELTLHSLDRSVSHTTVRGD